ncbi:MaoC family dehydratase [Roseibium sp.]|uniref:MaoC family dehydratase n=1 Tax=Roseibium sp. TaxID=1936156 RepID=UPI003B521E97
MIPDVQENALPVEALESLVGQEVGVSSWHLIDQPMIDGFADVTKDHQFIHVDPDAAAKTSFGGTIAHGFLTLSLLSAMGLEAQPKIAGAVMGINYGFDRVRFLSPVKAGVRIRGRFILQNLKSLKPGELDLTWAVTVEIEGENRPALSADWLNRFYLKDGST